jgi:hypothetical protein
MMSLPLPIITTLRLHLATQVLVVMTTVLQAGVQALVQIHLVVGVQVGIVAVVVSIQAALILVVVAVQTGKGKNMFKTLSLVVMLFAGGVHMDKPVPTVDAGVATPDAGVAQSNVVKTRREEFRVRINKAAVGMGRARHGTVSVQKLLWSTTIVSETEDSVLVLLSTPDGDVGLMFLFNEGKWDSLPDDFRP